MNINKNRLDDFLIIGQEDWNEVWKRNRFIILGLARRFPEAKILFVELPFDFTFGLRSRQILKKGSYVRNKFRDLKTGLKPLIGYPNVWTLVTPKIFPNSLKVGEILNFKIQAFLIKRALKTLNVSKPIFWTQNPEMANLVKEIRTKAIIYDNTDDWTAAGYTGKAQARALNGDLYLANNANITFTCSELLTKQKVEMGANVVLIRNGVDFDFYKAIMGEKITPGILKNIPRPILGYIGSLHSKRLDIPLILDIAKMQPNWSLVFIGPNNLTPSENKLLQNYTNIYLLGSQPYESIPAITNQLDILILPHLINSFTESLDPLKLYEYLASGRPFISTPVAGVRDYSECIYLARNACEFIEKVKIVQEEPKQIVEKRYKLAEENSWQKRIDEVIVHLKSITPD